MKAFCATICTVSMTACLAATTVNVAQAQTQPSRTNNYQTFTDWCLNQRQLSATEQHTIQILLEKAGTSNCERASQQLQNSTELNLVGQQISDLNPLG